MLVIVADGYDDSTGVSGRRDRFTCTEFSYAIVSDKSRGTVMLLPEKRILVVSTDKRDYVRVRVFGDTGVLVGAMTCVRDGRVVWSTVIYPKPKSD